MDHRFVFIWWHFSGQLIIWVESEKLKMWGPMTRFKSVESKATMVMRKFELCHHSITCQNIYIFFRLCTVHGGSNASQFLLGDPDAHQASWDMWSLLQVFGPPPGRRPDGRARKTSEGRWSRGIMARCPNHLSWLLSMPMSNSSAPSSLPDVLVLHPISKAKAGRCPEESHFHHVYPRPCLSGHYPELKSVGEGCIETDQ